MTQASKKTARKAKTSKGFTADERAAMKDRVQEMKGGDGESTLLAKIADMKEPARSMAKRLHAVVKAAAPGLESKTWYGMPRMRRASPRW